MTISMACIETVTMVDKPHPQNNPSNMGSSDMPAQFSGSLSDWKYLGARNCLSCCWSAQECQTDTSNNFAKTNEIGLVI